MKNYHFIAYIEKDPDTDTYFGCIPHLPGAHTLADSLDELHENLKEVTSLCLEEMSPDEKQQLDFDFIGTQKVSVSA